MKSELASISTGYLAAFGLILCVSLVLPGVLWTLRQRAIQDSGRSKKLISSEIFSFFASLYAFFLGFSIVTLWGAYGMAKSTVSAEAGAVMATFRMAGTLDNSSAFRRSLVAYATSVVEDEWPVMDAADTMSAQTAQRLSQAWDAYYAMKPAPESYNLYSAVGQCLADVGRQRIVREQTLTGNLYPPVWIIIGFGLLGVFTGLLLTNPEQNRSQVAMEIIVAFLVISCIYFIADIATPFSGLINVPAAPLTDVIGKMNSAMGQG
jgi:cytochrome b561